MRRIFAVLLGLLAGWSWCLALPAAIWKASGDLAIIHFDVELDDAQDPAVLFVRIENRSARESIKVNRYFVQLTEKDQRPLQPVTADEVVSENLKKLRRLMPEHEAEINLLLSQIRADFPQEKIVEVYARLKEYMAQGGRIIGVRIWKISCWAGGTPLSRNWRKPMS